MAARARSVLLRSLSVATTLGLARNRGARSNDTANRPEAGTRSRDVDGALDDLIRYRILAARDRRPHGGSRAIPGKCDYNLGYHGQVLKRQFSFHPSPEAGIGVVLIRAFGQLG
jgi:hypothetical protein